MIRNLLILAILAFATTACTPRTVETKKRGAA
jgi:hypothetical protein